MDILAEIERCDIIQTSEAGKLQMNQQLRLSLYWDLPTGALSNRIVVS